MNNNSPRHKDHPKHHEYYQDNIETRAGASILLLLFLLIFATMIAGLVEYREEQSSSYVEKEIPPPRNWRY